MAAVADQPSQRAAKLVSLIAAEGIRPGREDSFKMTEAGLLTRRFMLGLPLERLDKARVPPLCRALGMPEHCLESLLHHLPSADLILFGLEEDGEEATIKVYLEFWHAVRAEVQCTRSTEPLLINLGFKWRAGGDGQDAREARYVCFPLLSVDGILARMASTYQRCGESPGSSIVAAIVQQAAIAKPDAGFIYLEVAEQGNPRVSFDINLYKASLRVADALPRLTELAEHFSISAARVAQHLQPIAGCALGHLSAGVDKRGVEFVTTYYETQALKR